MKILLFFLILVILTNSLPYRLIRHHPSPSSTIPPKVFAGQVHFSRIPFQYWQHRIQAIKAFGLNALSVYVMWNYHEVQPGKWDFSTENRNLPAFLQLATKYNMSVLLRPGPYVCAEWDFGGLPAYLLSNPINTPISLRSTDPTYLAAVKSYFTAIAPIINKYDSKNGGPIVLLQIQNEYGSFGNDLNYINGLRTMWKDLNVTIDQYHADAASLLYKSHWPGGNMGVNGGVNEADYDTARKLDPSVFIFGGEIYTGWLTHWGEQWAGLSVDAAVREFTTLCNNNHSFSLYMVHGGTNFGFTAGANQMNEPTSDYGGHVTSYDYDAPINEQGAATAKYNALRTLFLKYVDWIVPEPPAPIKTITISSFTPTIYATLLANLPTPTLLPNYTHFQSKQLQMFNQGLVIYQFDLPISKNIYTFTVHDYAIVYINDQYFQTFNRSVAKSHSLNLDCKVACTVKILVEAMGHINYGGLINSDRKGLIEFKKAMGEDVRNWTVYKVPLEYEWVRDAKQVTEGAYPYFAKSTFDLQEVGDTYINVARYAKGYVWVNGRNLGRFWNRGPQYKLYCPGVWLKNKGNELIIMELERPNTQPITGDNTLKG